MFRVCYIFGRVSLLHIAMLTVTLSLQLNWENMKTVESLNLPCFSVEYSSGAYGDGEG